MTRRLALCVLILLGITPSLRAQPSETRLRVATFNIHDARTDAIRAGDDERLQRIAQVILDIRPDIILLNEIDQDEDCKNAQAFADHYLAVGQGEHEPMRYRAFMRPSNTGVHAGLDLDNNAVNDPNAAPRDFGGDCLGYAEYPGQYAMALLVREGLTIDDPHVRTFKNFLWKDMPGAMLPPMPDGAGAWYSQEELAILPLSSKSHWDVPVVLDNGAVVHILASHPTPPVFDGPEDRNGRRNHDEIRFWADYITGGQTAAYIRDDHGNTGGLAPDAHFVIVGDLNADPARGDSRDHPVALLIEHARVHGAMVPFSVTPTRQQSREGSVSVLADTMTARFGLRVDYVLPSAGVRPLGARIYRTPLDTATPIGTPRSSYSVSPETKPLLASEFPSDHFPVFVDVIVPPPPAQNPATISPVPSGKNP